MTLSQSSLTLKMIDLFKKKSMNTDFTLIGERVLRVVVALGILFYPLLVELNRYLLLISSDKSAVISNFSCNLKKIWFYESSIEYKVQ